MKEKEQIQREYDEKGFTLIAKVLNNAIMQEMKDIIISSLKYENEKYEKSKDQIYRLYTCIAYSDIFMEILDFPVIKETIEVLFQERYPIIHVYSNSSIPPHSQNGYGIMHVDAPRYYSDFAEGIGLLVMLDDFTGDNGGTFFLEGSHKNDTPPAKEYFQKNAKQITGKAGDIVFFNPRCWHAAGYNSTDHWRHSLSIGFSRPYLQQHVDIASLLIIENRIPESSFLKQLSGIYSLPCENIDDFYNIKSK